MTTTTAPGLHRTAALTRDLFPYPWLTKYVPTDMHWGGNYQGGYCEVVIASRSGPGYMVSIHGTDDCACVRFFDDLDEALALFNSLTYLQSFRDLVAFDPAVSPNTNNNGWPHERRILTTEFQYPEPFDDDVWSDEHYTTPVPW